MALHRLTSVCIGVPNVAETAAYYEEFGLTRLDDNRLATVDGGEQLRIVRSPRRRVVELGIGVADPAFCSYVWPWVTGSPRAGKRLAESQRRPPHHQSGYMRGTATSPVS